MMFIGAAQDNNGKSLDNISLTSALENPKNLAELFSDPNRGNLATDAMKVLAGENASETIEKLMNEVKKNANDSKILAIIF